MMLILASHNPGKFREFRQLVEGLDLTLVPQAVAGVDFEVNETGDSFEENAYLKASSVCAYTGFGAIADDSGLCVDALGGEPGVRSARYGQPGWDDRQRMEYLLERLEGVRQRQGRFVCCICCVLPGGRILRARGECPGRILEQPRGEGGFGYDPVFVPDGYEESFAQMEAEQKNRISHRALAMAEFRRQLKEAF